ncbi:serine hydrolase domain-containing protein [Streptomyces luteocolor]|uniref:serine hydrolase domain-containing protein n=1 Tax=Streptomyces luteocolor TaxID=285500 RepID=UPI00099F738B|nr:serine hydrolase domain-containing protein [Streptomyces luteocolor]
MLTPTAARVRPLLADDPPRAHDHQDEGTGIPADPGVTVKSLVRVGGTDGTWRGSSGVHDLVTHRKADPHGRFRAGSVTKIVTAAVALQLVAEGRLDLDEPVQHYLPGLLTEKFEPVPVRSLLNYTSGLKSGDGFDDEFAHRYDTLDPRTVVASAVAKGPEHSPGDEQHYRNIGYTVLGLLIEKVTGDSYAHQAEERIFGPLRMRDTYFPGTDPRIRGPHNRGYQTMKRADGTTRLVDVTEWNQYDRFAAGDMISSTADLEVFTRALFGGEVLPEPQLKEMLTAPEEIDGAAFGAGLQRMRIGDRVVWLKTGARYGYTTIIAATEDGRRTLVHSVNATDAKGEGMNAVAERIARAALS